MHNALIINRKTPLIARIIEAETRRRKTLRGADVGRRDMSAQLRVADRILEGPGAQLRQEYARQADRMALRDIRRARTKNG